MSSLARDLRKQLENTVKQARRVAEGGARKAVEQLAVGEGDAPKHLAPGQRTLRNRLRAHGRQLGDRREAKSGSQATSRLVQECAYEHWHRMWFARFLAETDLLVEPQSGVHVTLDEVQALAREQATDWVELASNYAEQMLPQIFRNGDPVLDISLPRETRVELEDLLSKLPPDVFRADDSLGWVYQFWQSDKKDAVNKSGTKIGADELPAVTQLFTEDYMVLFLLHNTLGAWWAGKVFKARPDLSASAKSEDEIRAACKVGEVEWTYLRFVRDSSANGTEGRWRPAGGTFERWPDAVKLVTLLDPCMGSGHFLVAALPIFVALRMAEEELSLELAIDSVLRDNLFGLEIDPRCTQIAAFNLAFTAWRMVGYRALPQMNLACSGLAIGVTKHEWLKLAEDAAELADHVDKRGVSAFGESGTASGFSERTKRGVEQLYELFSKAPWLGSLTDPRRSGGDMFSADFEQLELIFPAILSAAGGDEVAELAVSAQGMSKAGEILASHFTLVATNVPYLGRGKQDDQLRQYCELNYENSKNDLATCFIERCIEFCNIGGSVSVVCPQNWLFLTTYGRLREDLLARGSWNMVVKLGPAAFEDMNWWAAKTSLITVSKVSPNPNAEFVGIDASSPRGPTEKAALLRQTPVTLLNQSRQNENPDARILLTSLADLPLLGKHGQAFQGIATADYSRYGRVFWEIPVVSSEWEFQQSTVEETCLFGGREHILLWERGTGDLARSDQARIQGMEAIGKAGIAVSQMNQLPVTLFTGEYFDNNCSALVVPDEHDMAAVWSFCSSDEFKVNVREIDEALKVTNASLIKVPFDLSRWQAISKTNLPDGIQAQSIVDPTQWLFDGHPATCSSPLHIGVARLLGFRWPREKGAKFRWYPALTSEGSQDNDNSDGIVCLSATKGQAPAEQRLVNLLSDAFGARWSAAKLANLLAAVGFTGKTLDDWLRDGFFQQHCELFHQRPFVWQIWDGRRDGFHALLSYHQLAAPAGEGRRTLEKLIYSYLGGWIDRQRADRNAGVEGADGRLVAAEALRTELTKILEGEPPYDIFVRWKPLHEQSIGWAPDVNDGVRLNIRPFLTARLPGTRRTNACLLRSIPKIKWDKDRGKEPARNRDDFPWYWSCDEPTPDFAGGPEFDGNRWNNLHYSNAMKRMARVRYSAASRAKA